MPIIFFPNSTSFPNLKISPNFIILHHFITFVWGNQIENIWRAFHAKTEEVLRTINLRKCSEHPEVALTVRHLEEAHPRAGGWKLSNLLISERKGNTEWKEDAVELILRLTGPPLFSRQTGWQKPLNIISKCKLSCVVAWESTLNQPHLCLFWFDLKSKIFYIAFKDSIIQSIIQTQYDLIQTFSPLLYFICGHFCWTQPLSWSWRCRIRMRFQLPCNSKAIQLCQTRAWHHSDDQKTLLLTPSLRRIQYNGSCHQSHFPHASCWSWSCRFGSSRNLAVEVKQSPNTQRSRSHSVQINIIRRAWVLQCNSPKQYQRRININAAIRRPSIQISPGWKTSNLHHVILPYPKEGPSEFKDNKMRVSVFGRINLCWWRIWRQVWRVPNLLPSRMGHERCNFSRHRLHVQWYTNWPNCNISQRESFRRCNRDICKASWNICGYFICEYCECEREFRSRSKAKKLWRNKTGKHQCMEVGTFQVRDQRYFRKLPDTNRYSNLPYTHKPHIIQRLQWPVPFIQPERYDNDKAQRHERSLHGHVFVGCASESVSVASVPRWREIQWHCQKYTAHQQRRRLHAQVALCQWAYRLYDWSPCQYSSGWLGSQISLQRQKHQFGRDFGIYAAKCKLKYAMGWQARPSFIQAA